MMMQCNDGPTLLLSLLFLELCEREGGRRKRALIGHNIFAASFSFSSSSSTFPLIWSLSADLGWGESEDGFDGGNRPSSSPIGAVCLHITSATESVATFCTLYEEGHFLA